LAYQYLTQLENASLFELKLTELPALAVSLEDPKDDHNNV